MTENQDEVNINSEDVTSIQLSMRPIGIFESVFTRKNATPRQGALCTLARGRLNLIPKNCFGEHAQGHGLDGLEDFSHIWIIYYFHDNGDKYKQVKTKVQPPRLNGGKVGVFATRTPHRPNPIGLTLAKLEAVDHRNGILHLSGIDLIDGTYVLDIKPFIPHYDSGGFFQYYQQQKHTNEQQNLPNVRIASWIEQSPVPPIEDIVFTDEALKQLQECCANKRFPLKFYSNWQEVRDAIIEILKLDPRSTYRRKKCQDKIYYFHIDELNIAVDIKDHDTGTKAIVNKVEVWQIVLEELKKKEKILDDENLKK
jgi:tRNA-Thr(GGU) m(6)t(6)A37 methyltransferase TsaA